MATEISTIAEQLLSERSLGTFRLGQISFINNLPVVLPIQKGYVKLPVETIFGSPAELNQAYASGSLDVGAMSSFFYLEQQGFELVPGVSISCEGPVGSVLFFSRSEPRPGKNLRIVVPHSSATSINLLRVLLLESYGVSANFTAQPHPSFSDDTVDGVLLIGDQALAADLALSKQFHRFDLGQWWHQYCRLPMVFGVWAARQAWLRSQVGETFSVLAGALQQAANHGLTNAFEEVIEEARQRTSLSRTTLISYYREQLNFGLTERHLEGLRQYRDLCIKHRLLPE
jgi:chorismate dehydratase